MRVSQNKDFGFNILEKLYTLRSFSGIAPTKMKILSKNVWVENVYMYVYIYIVFQSAAYGQFVLVYYKLHWYLNHLIKKIEKRPLKLPTFCFCKFDV